MKRFVCVPQSAVEECRILDLDTVAIAQTTSLEAAIAVRRLMAPTLVHFFEVTR